LRRRGHQLPLRAVATERQLPHVAQRGVGRASEAAAKSRSAAS
jgi:hypothetical protein